MLVAAERGEELGFAFQYATALFDRVTVERLAGHFTRLLTAALASPRTPLAGLPLLSAAEERELLVDCNGPAAGGREDLCLHELFEAQAEQMPGAPALLWGEQRMTYGELE